VDWAHGAVAVDRLIRACTPAPGAWTRYRNARLKLGPVTLDHEASRGGLAPGELSAASGRVLVGTGTQPVVLGEVRPEGKRPMRATEWARGLRLSGGDRLG
jgi:methionyl-tRNA formyltransferase